MNLHGKVVKRARRGQLVTVSSTLCHSKRLGLLNYVRLSYLRERLGKGWRLTDGDKGREEGGRVEKNKTTLLKKSNPTKRACHRLSASILFSVSGSLSTVHLFIP